MGFYGNVPAQKAIMKMKGMGVGGVRLPFESLSEASYNALYGQLDAIGFFSWSS
jgi:hypothetical protein